MLSLHDWIAAYLTFKINILTIFFTLTISQTVDMVMTIRFVRLLTIYHAVRVNMTLGHNIF